MCTWNGVTFVLVGGSGFAIEWLGVLWRVLYLRCDTELHTSRQCFDGHLKEVSPHHTCESQGHSRQTPNFSQTSATPIYPRTFLVIVESRVRIARRPDCERSNQMNTREHPTYLAQQNHLWFLISVRPVPVGPTCEQD